MGMFLTEDGMVNGKYLSTMLKIWNPMILDNVDIPEDNFRLKDFVSSLIDVIFPRLVEE